MSKAKKFIEDLKKKSLKGVIKKAEHKDAIPGGKADKKLPSDFDEKQLSMGIKVEMEHTKDKKIAQEIAMDHLVEDKNYYSKLKEVHTEKSNSENKVGCGEGLSGKICRHNQKKLHSFVKKHKIQKSIDFHNTKVSIDSADQLLAEKTVSEDLIKYIKASIEGDISKISFSKGILTLAKKEEGLYSGFFQDSQGQVVEKFDDMTPEIVAKNMEIKNLAEMSPVPEAPPVIDQAIVAAHDRIDYMHNRIDTLQDQMNSKGKSLKISFGDFQLELRKSVRDFTNSFRRSKNDSTVIKKAIESWRIKNKQVLDIPNFTQAAKELFDNWEEHSEGFSQIVYALEQIEKKHG